jgi:VWFA-related protein
LPGLQRDQFEILDAGQPRRPEYFETVSSGLSLALLLDTTGSIREALPLLKNAAGRLIDRLRADDAVALFGFNDRIVCLQDFTSDFRSVKLAARRIRAEGTTSLFDALAGITQRVSERRGKKAIVAFTDGMDNSSVLNLNAATARATRAGLPVYSIAQGQALHSKQLVETLETISASTGAASYKARKPAEVEEVFDHIAGDLVNTYMLAFPVAPGKGEWHPLTVSVRVPKQSNLRVRCRQGYHAD